MITLHLAWRAFVVTASRVQCSSFALLQFESIRCNVAGKSLCRCSLFITCPSSPSRAVLPTLLVIIINPVVIFVHTAFVGCSCIPSGARPPRKIFGGMDGKFSPPSISKDVDAAKFQKLAQRVEQTLNTEVLFREPRQLDPAKILVPPLNKDGAPPNVQRIHFKKCFVDKGFDCTRPCPGICVKYTSELGKKNLIEHNRRFTQGNAFLPHEEAIYASLACAHLNIALRCIRAGLGAGVTCWDPQGPRRKAAQGR